MKQSEIRVINKQLRMSVAMLKQCDHKKEKGMEEGIQYNLVAIWTGLDT